MTNISIDTNRPTVEAEYHQVLKEAEEGCSGQGMLLKIES